MWARSLFNFQVASARWSGRFGSTVTSATQDHITVNAWSAHHITTRGHLLCLIIFLKDQRQSQLCHSAPAHIGIGSTLPEKLDLDSQQLLNALSLESCGNSSPQSSAVSPTPSSLPKQHSFSLSLCLHLLGPLPPLQDDKRDCVSPLSQVWHSISRQ